MATLHLMIGLPGSGKTTRAKELERQYKALRLTPDEWHLSLFGQDAQEEAHDERHTRVEALMWSVAARALALGVDVILDFGFWGREEREDFRARARSLGAQFRLHYMEVPFDELIRRLIVRNQSIEAGSAFYVSEENMNKWADFFEAPEADEYRNG